VTKLSIAVIVTTYNRPRALRWVLEALAHQTFVPSMVIVADDGSHGETRELVMSISDAWRVNSPRPKLKHVWHSDDGFRAGQIRNVAVACALSSEFDSPDQIIFLDGDCIPLPTFVWRHTQLLGTQFRPVCVAGGRVLLNRAATAEVEHRCRNLVKKDYLELVSASSLLRWRASGKLNRVMTLASLPDGPWRVMQPDRWRLVRTCNLSLWTKNFLDINGFNEDYRGWGLEDSDLAIRLNRLGVKIINGRFATNVIHLWHREADRAGLKSNQELLFLASSAPIRCENGLQNRVRNCEWG